VTKKEKKHAHENPAHPGRIVQSVCLEALGLSVTAGQNFRRYAEARNNLINGNSGISPQMAIRLMKAFGGMEETGCGCRLPMTCFAARRDERKIKVRRQLVPQELHPG
jgi:hypothetical protein